MRICWLSLAWLILALGNRARTENLSLLTKGCASATSPTAGEAVVVQYCDAATDAEWSIAQTANFRVLHTQSRELAALVGQTAERTRTAVYRKWFGSSPAEWQPRCDIYLHATARDYSLATGVPDTVPGHSSFRFDSGRLLSRRIDLHCDVPTMRTAVLPHETTHAVLHSIFGEASLPQWANEGMAVLTEPQPQIQAQLDRLARCRQARQLFDVQELMEMKDYPTRRMSAFYAQSVSLVAFLAASRDPQVFPRFLREATAHGFAEALEHHYGWSFADLDRHWQRYAFARDESANGGRLHRRPALASDVADGARPGGTGLRNSNGSSLPSVR